MTKKTCITALEVDPSVASESQDVWAAIQQELAGRVHVPRTNGLEERHPVDNSEGSASFLPTFLLPQALVEDFEFTVLGPQLRRDAERRSSMASPLQYVGGVDISFLKETSTAVACLVVMDYPSMQRRHTFLHQCEVTLPYVPGYLAFREAAPLVELIEKSQHELRDAGCYPQLLVVDGCGVHHPLRCGLASHLGVLLDIPTIGCAKKFMAVDGMTRKTVNEVFESALCDVSSGGGVRSKKRGASVVPIIGQSGMLWSYAATPSPNISRPIFISPGHRMGYAEAAALVLSMCKYRVPEPIRAADLSSREYIRSIALDLLNH